MQPVLPFAISFVAGGGDGDGDASAVDTVQLYSCNSTNVLPFVSSWVRMSERVYEGLFFWNL